KAYQTLGCAGMARVDVFLTLENDVVINEINTLPGFTNISMYPKLWQASGLSYTDLITRLIELALERHAASNALKTHMYFCSPGTTCYRASSSSSTRRRIIIPATQKLITQVTYPTA